MATELQLSFWERGPPLAAIAAAQLLDLPCNTAADDKFTKDSQPALQITSEKETLSGILPILRFVARSAGLTQKLYGSSPLQSVQVDQWLDYAAFLTAGPGLEAACAALDAYLAFRSFLVGFNLTIADLACWGQLESTPVWDKLKKTGKFPHVARWHEFIGTQTPMQDVAQQYDTKRKRPVPAKEAAASGSTAATAGDTGSYDIDLPGAAEGKVVTRFPPEPSGFLHIGHAKAVLLNQQIAQNYKGKMLLRFDDTNPTKEKDEYVESILGDVAALGVKYERLSYTSDYFPQMQTCADKLIQAGILYADDTPQEQMRSERMEGTESKRRNRSVEETVAAWQEMLKGSAVGTQHCLRFKMDMQAPNKALRDPVAYRCNPTPHWRTGHKYKAYPTYDYACPFVDAWEGVTHALRTTEYKDREAQFYWILKAMRQVCPELPHVHMWDFARLSLVYTLMSKRKLTWFVDTGRVSGWDDPRFPTIQGLSRRGLQLEALKEFILSQGASKNVTLQDWEKLWTINKRIVDPVCPRHTAVIQQQPVRLRLQDGPEQPEHVTLPKHKKFEGAGIKITTRTQEIWLDQEDAQLLQEGEEVTLMDWGNAIVQTIKRKGDAVEAMEGRLNLQGSVKTTKWKLTWLPCIPDLVPLTLVFFGHLITKKKLEEDDNFEDLVNHASRWETPAMGDANMRTLQKGDILQLERKGYFIVDAPLTAPGQPLVLFNTPDGHTKHAASKPVTAALPNGSSS